MFCLWQQPENQGLLALIVAGKSDKPYIIIIIIYLSSPAGVGGLLLLLLLALKCLVSHSVRRDKPCLILPAGVKYRELIVCPYASVRHLLHTYGGAARPEEKFTSR